jgi:hypothetical protein
VEPRGAKGLPHLRPEQELLLPPRLREWLAEAGLLRERRGRPTGETSLRCEALGGAGGHTGPARDLPGAF